MKHLSKTAVPLIVLILCCYTSCKEEPGPPDIEPVENLSSPFAFALIEDGVDTNADGIISHTEAQAVTHIDVQFRGLDDLNGIEAFINLISLNCYQNDLLVLDLSHNIALTYLDCGQNRLQSLDLSEHPALATLACGGNSLGSLDISANSKITSLWINHMPALEEVCVWTLPFPPAGIFADRTESPNVRFTTECSQ